jgi:hypothetical protein
MELIGGNENGRASTKFNLGENGLQRSRFSQRKNDECSCPGSQEHIFAISPVIEWPRSPRIHANNRFEPTESGNVQRAVGVSEGVM